MRFSFFPLIGTLLLVPGNASTQFSLPATQFEVGQVFPDVVLPRLEDGAPGSLAQFRGKKVILHIFGSW